MTPFTVQDLTEDEAPRDPTYVNVDAAWLVRFSRELEGLDEPSEATLRLRTIAQHLERLDEKFRNLQGDDAYAAGIREGRLRMLAKSNLPTQSVEITSDLREAVARATVPVKRIPMAKPTTTHRPSQLTLNGVKLNLAGLK